MKNPYTGLARETTETFARRGEIMPVPEGLPPEFYATRKGVFVTIHKSENDRRKLRGCVGTFEPTRENIAQEIIQNAIFASQEDDRFRPVSEDELETLDYEISLLEPPERIYSDQDLDSDKYGVILKTEDGRCGLLLPGIEGIDSPLHQIRIAADKGGIDLGCDQFSLWRFAVKKYTESNE